MEQRNRDYMALLLPGTVTVQEAAALVRQHLRGEEKDWGDMAMELYEGAEETLIIARLPGEGSMYISSLALRLLLGRE